MLAAKAAGLGINMYQQRKAKKYEERADALDKAAYAIDMQGLQANQAELDLRMQQEQLASTEQSLFATEQLREILASQRAMFAARGQAPVKELEQSSTRAYSADERAREFNLSGKQLAIKGQKNAVEGNRFNISQALRMMDVKKAGRKDKRRAELFKKTFNSFSMNELDSMFG